MSHSANVSLEDRKGLVFGGRIRNDKLLEKVKGLAVSKDILESKLAEQNSRR